MKKRASNRVEPLQLDSISLALPRQFTAGLSHREIEILKLVTSGRSIKEVGKQLCLSVKTVETHSRNIQVKTECDGVAMLTHYAIARGYISLIEFLDQKSQSIRTPTGNEEQDPSSPKTCRHHQSMKENGGDRDTILQARCRACRYSQTEF